jgi:hypothetical protein
MTMDKIPFTTYDFWAYLSAGFLMLFCADYVAQTQLFARPAWTVVQAIVAVTAAYATGQIVAQASAALFERVLVDRVLGAPRDVLFGHARLPARLRWMMPRYFQPLPAHARAAIAEKSGVQPAPDTGETLFQIAFQHARETQSVAGRLTNFLNQYGFCRNIAFVCLISSVVLYAAHRWWGRPLVYLHWSWLSIGMSFAMTIRYLKFYHHYAKELLTSYAYAAKPK